jgi:hypothetical protein
VFADKNNVSLIKEMNKGGTAEMRIEDRTRITLLERFSQLWPQVDS